MVHIHKNMDWVTTVFIIKDDKVLLVKHKELNKWLPVGGHVELDEDPEQALYREVEEECGLKIKLLGDHKPKFDDPNCKILPLPAFLDIHTINPDHKHICLVYFAHAESGTVKLAEKEHHDIRWFSLKEIEDHEYKIVPSVRFYAENALKAAKNK